MFSRTLQPTSRHLRSSVLALCAALCITVFLSTAAFANNVEIYDNARVLNASQVQSDASSLSDPIRIYTFPSYNGTVSQFNNQAVLSENTTKTIVIAINTGARYVYIAGGKDAGLNSSDYNNAITAFKNNFNGSYTNATIAAIDSLKSKLGSGFSINPVLGALCCVGLIALVAFGVFGALRRRGRGNVAPTFNAPTAYGPQNFGPQNYGAPQQGGGMNPWVAGGLGAAGGGFLGYELGKLEGEREARREMQGGFGGEQGGFGGGAGGFFGGGGGGFGGDQGGGGGFGAGGSFGGDQGGGGGFGGGGGNESFGGFSGGDSNNNDGGGGGNF